MPAHGFHGPLPGSIRSIQGSHGLRKGLRGSVARAPGRSEPHGVCCWLRPFPLPACCFERRTRFAVRVLTSRALGATPPTHRHRPLIETLLNTTKSTHTGNPRRPAIMAGAARRLLLPLALAASVAQAFLVRQPLPQPGAAAGVRAATGARRAAPAVRMMVRACVRVSLVGTAAAWPCW